MNLVTTGNEVVSISNFINGWFVELSDGFPRWTIHSRDLALLELLNGLFNEIWEVLMLQVCWAILQEEPCSSKLSDNRAPEVLVSFITIEQF